MHSWNQEGNAICKLHLTERQKIVWGEVRQIGKGNDPLAARPLVPALPNPPNYQL